MARPTKQGIDYFPIDVEFDDKTQLFLFKHGASGAGVLLTVWQLIYANRGYYIDWSEDLLLLLQGKLLIEPQESEIILKASVEREIFCPKKFEEFKILTSKAIQKRFFGVSGKKKIVYADRNYLLEGVFTGGNVSLVGVLNGGNPTKVKVDVKENVNVNVNTIAPETTIQEKIRKSVGKKPGKPLTTWPEGFELSDSMKAYAEKKGVHDPADEFEAFKNWADQSEKQFKDWPAAFRTRCDNYVVFSGNKKSKEEDYYG